jgi:hypothetical protein
MMTRQTERRLLAAAAAWWAALAVITLIPYRIWFEQRSSEAVGETGGESLIAAASGAVAVYGMLVLLGAMVTGWLAWRIGTAHVGAVLWWTGACAAGALLTRDVIGCLLFTAAGTVYWARTRALRTVSEPTPSATCSR